MDRYATLRQGLVMAWCPSLGDSGYTLRDYSPYRRNGSLVNMDGQNNFPAAGGGRGVSFDGSNDYAQTTLAAGIPTGGQARTISTWVFLRTNNSTASGRGLVQLVTTSGQTFLLDLTFISGIYALFTDGVNGANNLTYPSAPPINTWLHIAITMDAARVYAAYQNGVVIRSGTFASAINTGPIASVRVGARSASATIDGIIDDVRIYNRALSRQEVLALYSGRGVGLLPSRHRRANVLGSQFWLRDAGTWKKATGWIKVNGVWTKATPKLNVSGTWK